MPALARRQRERLLEVQMPAARHDKTVELIEQAAAGRLACPRCQSRHFYRHRRAHGLQRYRCKDCGRPCNELSGSALARLRQTGRWLDYLGGMLESPSIRPSKTNPGVSGTTSFRWRHRLLTVSKVDRVDCLAGIAEAEKMHVLESHKGARNLDRPPGKRGGKATKHRISHEQGVRNVLQVINAYGACRAFAKALGRPPCRIAVAPITRSCLQLYKRLFSRNSTRH